MLLDWSAQQTTEPMALTVGAFDGVHLGHKYLIERLKEKALERGLKSGVVTFYQHPREILYPNSPFHYLAPREQSIRMLKELGVKVFVLSFTKELSQLSAREFLSRLIKFFKMKLLVAGPDFALGRGREGNLSILSSLTKELNFELEVALYFQLDGVVVSSTAIKEALACGDIEKANKFLGHPFTIWGIVVSGWGLGKVLGFPTANLSSPPNLALPADGVYAAWAHLGNHTFPSAMYIGSRPTFSGQERTIEAHLLGVEESLYGREISLEVIAQIRGEKKFASPQELSEQIGKDIQQVRGVLGV